jgi:hypothetical protein
VDLGALPGELSSDSSPQRGLLRAAASWQSPCTTAASTRRVGGAGASHHFRTAGGDSWRGLGALPGELSSESSPQRGLLRVAGSWQSPCTTAASTRRVGGAGASHIFVQLEATADVDLALCLGS